MKATYYCPRGCNVFETESEDPECAACGRTMLADSEPFEEAHDRMELEGIAECERKLKEAQKSK
jgi:hypothetical protein